MNTQRVMQFIERKGKGHVPKLHAVKRKGAAGSLDAALQRSLKSLKKGKRAA
jgi:hypothetical protein